MVSKKGTRRRITAAFDIRISQQTTRNIDLQTTKTLDWFLIQKTDDISREIGSNNQTIIRRTSAVDINVSQQTEQDHD